MHKHIFKSRQVNKCNNDYTFGAKLIHVLQNVEHKYNCSNGRNIRIGKYTYKYIET